MIISSISECDHKCETQNAEPEIGTDGSSQTRQHRPGDGYGSGFGPPRVSGSGSWTGLEPMRPICAVQTQTAGGLPGPIANTTNTLFCQSNNQHLMKGSQFFGSIPNKRSAKTQVAQFDLSL
jgi:hypothetical protein